MATGSALRVLAPGVAVWLGSGRFGHPNAGVVVDTDGLTLIDTLTVASQWGPFSEAVAALERPVRRVVLTSSHIPFVGGTSQFQMAAFYGSAHTAELLDLAPNVAGYRRLLPELAAEFDDELATRPVSHTVEADAALTDAVVVRVTARTRQVGGIVSQPGTGGYPEVQP